MSRQQPQKCYSKTESTGKKLNIRYIIRNIEDADAQEIYFGFYVKRGESSENRIKEVKNMCFSDRLSNHNFWAIFVLLKEAIKKTNNEEAKKWQINTIRVSLLKIGATIKNKKAYILLIFKSFC